MTTDFDRVSYHYEETLDETLTGVGGHPSDYYLQLKVREVLACCQRWGVDPSHSRILDVGCGTGRIVELLQSKFQSACGVDPSP